MPETCEPTLTVTSAETSPVALTLSFTVPRVTGSVRYGTAAVFAQAEATRASAVETPIRALDLMSAPLSFVDADHRRTPMWSLSWLDVSFGEVTKWLNLLVFLRLRRAPVAAGSAPRCRPWERSSARASRRALPRSAWRARGRARVRPSGERGSCRRGRTA